MLFHRPQQRRLTGSRLSADIGEGIFDVEIEFRHGDHAIAATSCPMQVGGAGETFQQRQRERRVIFSGVTHAERVVRRHIQRTLVRRRGGEYLPGLTGNEPAIPLLVHQPWRQNQMARRGPAKRAGKAAIENHEHVTAAQLLQRFTQCRHRQVTGCGNLVGVLRQQIALRTVAFLLRDAMSREVEDNPVLRAGQFDHRRKKRMDACGSRRFIE